MRMRQLTGWRITLRGRVAMKDESDVPCIICTVWWGEGESNLLLTAMAIFVKGGVRWLYIGRY